jgi:hypothetical protein
MPGLSGPALLLFAGEEDTGNQLPLEGAVAGFTAGPLRIAQPTAAPLSARVVELPGYTLVGELPDSFARQILDPIDDPGSGSLTLWNDDPALAWIEPNQIVQVLLFGEVVFAWLIETKRTTLIDLGEESVEATELSGAGVDKILDRGRVYPSLGPGVYPTEIDRLFSWPSPQYVPLGWVPGQFTGNPGDPTNWPVGYEDLGEWIWGPSGTPDFAPGGAVYAIYDFTVAADVPVQGYTAADNWAVFYVDGQKQLVIGGPASTGQLGTYRRTFTFEIQLSAGPHRIAVRLYNKGSALPGPLGNHGGFRLLGLAMAADGTVTDDVIFESNEDFVFLEYPPEPPGMTPGEVGRISLTEPQERTGAALAGIGKSFTDSTATDGEPWAIRGDIATKVGTGVQTFWREMAGTYIDFRLQPGAPIVDFWRHGARGDPVDVELVRRTDPDDPRTGNLIKLVTEETGFVTTSFLVLSQTGWSEVLDTGAIDDLGRNEELLGLGAQQDAAEAARVARGQLVRYKTPRLQVTAGVLPNSLADCPWLAYENGDTLADVDELGPLRVMQIKLDEDEEGEVEFELQLNDRFLSEGDQLVQAIQKFSAGVVGGDTPVPTPTALIDVSTPEADCCPPPVEPGEG